MENDLAAFVLQSGANLLLAELCAISIILLQIIALFNFQWMHLCTFQVREMKMIVQRHINRRNTKFDLGVTIRSRTITDGLMYALSTGNWNERGYSGGSLTGMNYGT